MRASSAVHATLVLALIAACFATDGSRNRITVRKYRTNYRIDSWNDDREDPYRVTFWKFGLKSVYTFDTTGNIKTLTARDTLYTFDEEVGRRMLAGADDDALRDVDIDPVSEIACSDCQATWTAVCSVGIADVCFLHENPINDFDEDGIDSVRRMCSGFGAACESSAFDACDGQCTEEDADPAPTPAPVDEATPSPMAEATPAPVTETTPAPMVVETRAPGAEITPAPMAEAATPAPVAAETTTAPVAVATPSPMAEVTSAPVADATPAPMAAVTTAPSAPTEEDACNPSPCENGGSCTIDPAGGYTCSCDSGYGGMTCQTDTSSLDSFYIELDFSGTWTDSRQAVVQTAADRWSEVITHVPCGGSTNYPGGRLLITSTLQEIDGVDGTLGTAGPTSVWNACKTISAEGDMTFDIDDIDSLEADGTFEGVILHEMGHVIGIGTLWGDGYAECTTCSEDNDPAWTCPAAVSAYSDIGGAGADIVELDGGDGTSCGHLDEAIFTDELMTGFIDDPMYLSKMTAAILDDLDYIVDPSAADSYTLPSERDASIKESGTTSTGISDTIVETVIRSLDEDGEVIEELVGIGMVF